MDRGLSATEVSAWEEPSLPQEPSIPENDALDRGSQGAMSTLNVTEQRGGSRRASDAPSLLRAKTNSVMDAISLLQEEMTLEELHNQAGTTTHNKGNTWQARARWLVMHRHFTWCIAFAILLNAVYIGIETQFAEEDGASGTLPMPWSVLDLLFVIVFAAELAIRLVAERLRFFLVGWNLFDFTIVLTAALDKVIMTIFSASIGLLDVVTVMRVLRIARVLRIFRLLRFCRELWLIVMGIFGAMRTLFWAWMLIFLICYIGSIFITRTIGHEAPDNPEVVRLFGTVPRSFFSLFQVLTVDDWVDVVEVAQTVGWFAKPFFVLFIIGTTLAVLNVVVAVIVEKTLENSLKHKKEQLKHWTESERKSKEMIENIFQIADEDGNGTLTKEEFLSSISKPSVMRFMHEVGVEIRRVDRLFDVLDYDKSGALDISEFVGGVMKARGEARSKDVLELHCDLWRWEQSMKQDVRLLQNETEECVDSMLNEVISVKRALGHLKQSIAPLMVPQHSPQETV